MTSKRFLLLAQFTVTNVVNICNVFMAPAEEERDTLGEQSNADPEKEQKVVNSIVQQNMHFGHLVATSVTQNVVLILQTHLTIITTGNPRISPKGRVQMFEGMATRICTILRKWKPNVSQFDLNRANTNKYHEKALKKGRKVDK